jgi:hypothetical protein
MTGLVTIQNQSGKQFDNARIKLMAGDVSKLARLGIVSGVLTARGWVSSQQRCLLSQR